MKIMRYRYMKRLINSMREGKEIWKKRKNEDS